LQTVRHCFNIYASNCCIM